MGSGEAKRGVYRAIGGEAGGGGEGGEEIRDLRFQISNFKSEISRRIEAAFAAWVAAEHSLDRFPTAAEGAVFCYGVDGVLAAGGVEAALASEKRAEGDAVE